MPAPSFWPPRDRGRGAVCGRAQCPRAEAEGRDALGVGNGGTRTACWLGWVEGSCPAQRAGKLEGPRSVGVKCCSAWCQELT